MDLLELLEKLNDPEEQVWRVPEDAVIDFGRGRNPFEGMVITFWEDQQQ